MQQHSIEILKYLSFDRFFSVVVGFKSQECLAIETDLSNLI